MTRLAALVAAAAMALALAAPATADAPPWQAWSDPLALALYQDDHTVVLRSSFSPEPCLYDDAGQVLPAARDCRFDHLFRPLGRHRYLRAEADELVLVDERGAGALVRIWMTTGDGFGSEFPADLRLRARLDGNPIPYVDLPVRQWFDGSTWPFLPPLVGNRKTGAGASYGYVPIAFRTGLTVSLSGPTASLDAQRIWYQFTVHRLPVAVTGVDSGVDSGVPADIDAFNAFVATPVGGYPWPQAPSWQASSTEIPAGGAVDLVDTTGSGILLGLRLRPDALARWSDLRLTAVVDGDMRMDLPLAAVFGWAVDHPGAAQSLVLGVDGQGFGYLYLPQPFRHAFQLRLENVGAQPVAVDQALAWSTAAVPATALRLGAAARSECLDHGRQGPDLTLLELAGRGRWLGLLSDQRNLAHDNSNYLEGDERLYLDGSPHPAWYGTGTEDFYNGGFYFDQAGYGFAHAFALTGAPWHQMAETAPVRSRMYRMLLTDAVPFHDRLQLRLERGAYGDQPMCSDVVAWYYGEPMRGLAAVARLDLSDPDAVAAAGYLVPPDASCGPLTASFADEPPTTHSGRVCRYSGGPAEFDFTLALGGERFWLRRRFDGQAGGQAATVEVDGQAVARLPYAMAHPHRRWQDVDVPLALGPRPAGSVLALRIIPDDPDTSFTDSYYVLSARAGDALFADGFEAAP